MVRWCILTKQRHERCRSFYVANRGYLNHQRQNILQEGYCVLWPQVLAMVY